MNTAAAALVACVAMLAAVPARAGQAPAAGEVAATVRALADVISNEYFDVPAAARVADRLANALGSGRYGDARSDTALAARLTEDLYAVTRDKHLRVSVTAPPTPAGSPPARRDVPTTAGFERTEILAGNVGYLNLTMFLRLEEHRDAMAAAMKALQPARALILDMRSNGGGSPETVALLCSYLFDEPGRALFEVIPRKGEPRAYATVSPGIEDRNGRRPVYVLTSARSFSGGEGLAFLLQDMKRATVVGERTAGAANPGRPYRVTDRFEVVVPNGQLLTAATRRNWEGTGVTPDIIVPAEEALAVALRLAAQRTP